MAYPVWPWVTVVSGLPRSGTSLMMQMLGAGGMPLSVDDARRPDIDNPRGYFELDVLRTLPIAPHVLDVEGLIGTAVKVVCPLLTHLPDASAYRVILMNRNIEEVLTSQRVMLGRRGAAASDEPGLAQAMLGAVEDSRRWAAERPGVRLLDVDFGALVSAPRLGVAAVSEFLGGGLTQQCMAAVVDGSLYRNRVSTPANDGPDHR